jgi:hypothetical protein
VATAKNLTFNGSASVTVPVGQVATSDPVTFTVAAMQIVTINMYLQAGHNTNQVTSHPGSRTFSWFANGNQINAADITGTGKASIAHWQEFTAFVVYILNYLDRYYISAVDAVAPTDHSALVIVGDSITDGRGSDNDKNNR